MLKILIVLFMIVLVREIIETLRSKKIPFPLNKILKNDSLYILYTATLTVILAVLLLIYFKGNLPTV
ncbi:hypothetical protein [Lagierella massiliensis]|uniref:hypothetical protein n=1 Tax=Lagierella massiliensis TaxID=1689303 RepID=UPI0006D8459E|nr:hypothetical protein [Lagierella massiliensis]